MKKQFHFANFFSVAITLFASVIIMIACGKGPNNSKEQVASY